MGGRKQVEKFKNLGNETFVRLISFKGKIAYESVYSTSI